jgi:DNA-binding CsgD family transcriptional regulator
MAAQMTQPNPENGLRSRIENRYQCLSIRPLGRKGGMQMDPQQLSRLTDRQKDCLRLVAQGFTSKEIGRLLDLSPSTVDNHITTAVQALELPSRGEAARALTGFELRQNLPRQSQPLADTHDAAMLATEAEEGSWGRLGRQLLTLPPVGGKQNDLDGTSRTLRILQVAVLATASVIVLTILISGLFRTFS